MNANDLTPTQIETILDDVGLEQILVDANFDLTYIISILHDAGYLDLSIYLEEVCDEY